MARIVIALLVALLVIRAMPQDGMPKPLGRSKIPAILTFEAERAGESPKGWDVASPGTIFADNSVVHNGLWSARIERTSNTTGNFSAIEKTVLADFKGKTIELRGFFLSEGLSGSANLYIRQNGAASMLAFDKSQLLPNGTHDWTEYAMSAAINGDARQISFGVAVDGRGTVWVSDLKVIVDGKPIADALNRQAEAGSGMNLTKLTDIQIANFATFGKVWGFLKYHHPLVTAGKLDWDKECLRVLPELLAARDRLQANELMLRWIGGMGTVAPCTECTVLDDANIQLHPEIEWIKDANLLGKNLSLKLQSVYKNRVAGTQFYVAMAPGVGNPIFNHEPDYEGIVLLDSGYQILAVFRLWNIIEYWAPDRNLVEHNWDEMLTRFLPRVALAQSADAYALEMMALIAEVHDTHANLWSSLNVRPPVGSCELPVTVRFLGNDAVVTGFRAKNSETVTHLRVGDVIEAIDGSPVSELVAKWHPYYAASNQPTVLRDMARAMTTGPCGHSHVRTKRADQAIETDETRYPVAQLKPTEYTHDLPGDTFRLLNKDVAYLKLSSVKLDEVKGYIDSAKGTKAWIIDIRNYPSAFVVFALGGHLVDKQTPFARFTGGDLSNPGAFHWTEQTSILVEEPYYSGKVAILVDEVSQSQAEYTAMAFRSSPQAVVIGSTTAGADGNVSAIPLPGGLRSMISGIGVFYPEKKPTQRIGIIPDVVVTPTIAGIREGRDEVLEEALRVIGKTAPGR